jgi:hemoglobin
MEIKVFEHFHRHPAARASKTWELDWQMTEPQRASPYRSIGGEAGVRRLVNLFYDIVENDPAGAPLLIMHSRGHGIAHAREAQFEFLSGFLGGPQLYAEHHGHSNVRKMHEHLAIGAAERDAWIACMEKALHALAAEPAIHELLMRHFSRVAETLRTRD